MEGIKLGKDPLFTLIEITHELKTRFSKISFFIRILGVFAAVSLMTSLISTVFYENKQHLQYMGLISLFHIFNLLLTEFNQKWKHRYIFLTVIIIHCLWLGSTCLFLITYIFILEPKENSSKRDFNKEIHFHVVLFLYFATSLVLFYHVNDFCEYLIRNPLVASKEETIIQKSSTSSIKSTGSSPPLPPPLPLVHPPSYKSLEIPNLGKKELQIKPINELQLQLKPIKKVQTNVQPKAQAKAQTKVQPKVQPTLSPTKMPIKLNKVAKK
ncbi:uncharacterized protein LOC107359051 [Tetranychus urticae]|uniref:uncharacterized protein LOC107359051 n=1 Tax=Tetranychus urticae TaxID=32264 RepID=UPI00077BB110|nr:uncharacterized protein LOC107359051 [Tetranychus urticae]